MDVFSTEIEQESHIDGVFREKNDRTRLPKATSEELTSRKRRVRETLFKLLGYRRLLFSFVVRLE